MCTKCLFWAGGKSDSGTTFDLVDRQSRMELLRAPKSTLLRRQLRLYVFATLTERVHKLKR